MQTYIKPLPGELWRVKKSWIGGSTSGLKSYESVALVVAEIGPRNFEEIVFTSYEVVMDDMREVLFLHQLIERLC